MSLQIPSGSPQRVTQLIAPQPLVGLEPVLDAENVTLQWPVPRGRVDAYSISWYPVQSPEEQRTKTITGDIGRDSVDGVARILIESLQPGVNYHFDMTTRSYNLTAPTITRILRTQPLCTSEIFIIIDEEVTSALTLRYTPTPKQRSNFDTYRFMLSDPEVPIKEKAASDQDRKVTFVGLNPGRLYNITLWTVSGGVTSRPLERQDRLHPEPVSNINAEEVTDREISLTWELPKGNYDSFEVTYLDTKSSQLVQKVTYDNRITLSDLRPYKNYTFTVVTKAGTDQSFPKRSTPISAFFTTREGIPGSLTSFEIVDIRPSLITFKWKLPGVNTNGIITGFEILWGYTPEPGQPFTALGTKPFGPTDTQGTVTNLTPGLKYTFQIKAKTRVGFGPKEEKTRQMPILAPPVPAKDVIPTEISRSMHTIQIRYRENYFSDENGKVLGYTIIVAEDYLKPTDDVRLPSWREVQRYSSWPPYQVNDAFNPFNKSAMADFTVGTDENCLQRHGYCNGPLRPGTLYRFKVRLR